MNRLRKINKLHFLITYIVKFDRFVTKEQRNKHLYSSRHLQREVNGFWPAYFAQRKLTRDEGSILKKAFWEMIFGSVDLLPMCGFLKIYIMNYDGYKYERLYDTRCWRR